MTIRATIDVPCFLGLDLYAHLTKDVDFPSLPAVGLNIAFKLKAYGEEESKRYKALVTGCFNSTGLVIVESLSYYPQKNAENKDLYIYAMPATTSKESEMTAYIALMEGFYGFSVELCT